MKAVHRFSRRSLLGASAVGSAGLVLAACGQVQMTGEPMEQDVEAPQEEAEQPQSGGARARYRAPHQPAR